VQLNNYFFWLNKV